jgi:hypothetical protein
LLAFNLANGLAENQFFPTRRSLKQPYHPMDINHAIDDSIDDPKPLEPNPPWSEVLTYKFFTKSEEDLDCLPQVRGGFESSMTSRRRIWIAYYKSEEDLDRLLQVGGGFGSPTTSRRRIWIVYYNSKKD